MANWAARRADQIRARADRQTQALCDQIYARYVVPFCDRTGLHFSSGMGSWSFHHRDGRSMDEGSRDEGMPKMPKRLLSYLIVEDPTSRNDLGSIMGSYTPLTYKGR